MADQDWVDVTDQHVPAADKDSDWEDVTHAHATGSAPDSDYQVPSIPTPLSKQGRDHAMVESAMAKPGQITQAVTNGAAMMGGGGLTKAFGEKAAGLLGMSAEGGALGAAQAGPDNRLHGFLTGAAAPAVLGGVSKATGTGARALIQKAMGIKEPTAEIGQQMLDQGIWGTRNSMGKQVEKALSSEGKGLTDAVGNIDGAIEVSPLAQTLDSHGNKLAIGGAVPPALQGQYNKFVNEANYLGERGAMSPQDLLKYKQVQGNNAYSMRGSPLTSDEAQVSGTASREAGDLLKAKYAEQFPGQPNAIADQNAKLSALFKAKAGLEKKPSLVDYLKGAGATAAAKVVGGPAAAAAVLAAKSSLGQSGAAQGLGVGQKVLDKIDPAVLRTILLSNGSKVPVDDNR